MYIYTCKLMMYIYTCTCESVDVFVHALEWFTLLLHCFTASEFVLKWMRSRFMKTWPSLSVGPTLTARWRKRRKEKRRERSPECWRVSRDFSLPWRRWWDSSMRPRWLLGLDHSHYQWMCKDGKINGVMNWVPTSCWHTRDAGGPRVHLKCT